MTGVRNLVKENRWNKKLFHWGNRTKRFNE